MGGESAQLVWGRVNATLRGGFVCLFLLRFGYKSVKLSGNMWSNLIFMRLKRVGQYAAVRV